MVVIGIDAHKRTHTAVIIDDNGRKRATKTCETSSKDHLALLRWAAGHAEQRVWAIEDCRNMTRRLERDLLAAGERIVRVPPKLMAHARDAARTYGKSDPIDALAVAEAEIRDLADKLVPTLIALPGCGPLTAAKILGETAGITRFHSAAAYARHNGTAPLPVWSSNRARHRLSRTGNRQLNAALHRIAMTQARCHPPAKDLITCRKAGGDGGLEALRVLKRRLSDVVYQALRIDSALTG